MSNSALIDACKRLKLGSSAVGRAAKIKTESHSDFLLGLFTGELEGRDRKRRNAYSKAAGFSIPKTFEKYTFEGIKFPKTLTADDVMEALYAMIGVNKLTYDHDEYIKGINKLIAVGAALGLETGGVTNG